MCFKINVGLADFSSLNIIQVIENPFAHGYIPSEDAYTIRGVLPVLYKTDADGSHSLLFNSVLEALEQTDYCNFEVK